MSQIVFEKIVGLNKLDIVAKKLADTIGKKNIIVLLTGEVATGKTTLVQQYLKAIGINDKATSPTFSLQNIYDGGIYHYDIYNATLEKFVELGLFFELDKPGVHLVEWGNDSMKKMLQLYGFAYITVHIKKHKDRRRYKICTS